MSFTEKFRDQAAPFLDTHDYPRRWAQYVGQEPAKRMLQVSAKSARVRRQPLEHTLIAHPSPGIGKTALAVLVATEMKRPCRVASGALGRDAARIVFSGMQDGDILFYDEIHQQITGKNKDGGWMLSYMQDGVIAGPMGAEVQPKVTIIGATTDPQKLPEALVSRFSLQPPMQEYTAEEAAKIAVLMAKDVLLGLPKLSTKDALQIGIAAQRNPRAIRRMLVVLRDMVIADALPGLVTAKGRYNIDALLEFQGITHDGLDRTAQRYLITLATEFAGSAGAKALEDRLQQPGGLTIVERMLMDQGLVAKTRTGRTLTQAGIKRFRELTEAVA